MSLMIESVAQYLAESMTLDLGETVFVSHLPDSPNVALAVIESGGEKAFPTGVSLADIQVIVRDTSYENGSTTNDTIQSLLNAKQIPIVTGDKVDVLDSVSNTSRKAYISSVAGYAIGDWIKFSQTSPEAFSYRQLTNVDAGANFLEWSSALSEPVDKYTDLWAVKYCFALSTALPIYVGVEENGLHQWSNNFRVTVK